MVAPARSSRRPAPLTSLALIGLLLAAACSGSGGGAAGPTSSVAGAPETAGSAEIQRFPLRTTLHADGFRLTVEDVTVRVDRYQRWTADVAGSLTNAGPEPVPVATPIAVERLGRRWDGELTVTAPVAAGATVDVAVSLPVDAGADLAGGRLVVGPPGTNQASAPLGTGDPAVTNEPVAAATDAEAVAGEMRVRVRRVEVRADDPLGHETLPAGRRLVVLTFDVRRGAGGDPTLGADNVRLGLPDGPLVGPRADGRSSPNLVLDPGGSAEGAVARFEVPVPTGRSRYRLVVTGPFQPFGDEIQGEVSFDVPDVTA